MPAKSPKRTKPSKVKAEKYIKDKTFKNEKHLPNEYTTVYVARVHGVTEDELKSAGIILGGNIG